MFTSCEVLSPVRGGRAEGARPKLVVRGGGAGPTPGLTPPALSTSDSGLRLQRVGRGLAERTKEAAGTSAAPLWTWRPALLISIIRSTSINLSLSSELSG